MTRPPAATPAAPIFAPIFALAVALAAFVALRPAPAAAGCWQVCSGSLGARTPTAGGCLGQTVCHADDRKARANCTAVAARATRNGLLAGTCEKRS